MRASLVLLLAACGGTTDARRSISGQVPTPVATACTPATFAVNGACNHGACIQLLEVTTGCEVRQVRELTATSGDYGVVDIAWPAANGPLHLVARMHADDEWHVGTIANPRTINDEQLDKLVLQKVPMLGEVEPGGHRFGIEDDRGTPVLTGCASWGEDNPDAEEVEEWECARTIFRTLDGKTVNTPPLPAHVSAWQPGEVMPGVELQMVDDRLECRTRGPWKPLDQRFAQPIGVAKSGARYFLAFENSGSRAQPNVEVSAIAMTGCEADQEMFYGAVVIGPAGLYAYRKEAYNKSPWQLFRPGSQAPLVGADGKPFAIAGDQLVFAR